jgi:hypothetical protein
VKEITALPMILTLGALVVVHRSWLGRGASRGLPFALTLAAGVSALGAAFGVWGLVAAIVLAVIAVGHIRDGRIAPRPTLTMIGAGAIALLVAAWPTWIHVSGAIRIANNIATTSNGGNLHSSLRPSQVFGVWLVGTYKLSPIGGALQLTQAFIVLMGIAAVLGAVHLIRTRAYALAGWLACMLLAWLVVSQAVTTWAGAKTLVLSSPILVILAWAGVAALQSAPAWSAPPLGAALLASVIVAGIAISDALQYHNSYLAPTARYQELASVNSRFAGRGPALFTDYDEYSLYVLHDLDIGGPNFQSPPPALVETASYLHPVRLDRAPPRALLRYPLIVTRRNPTASPPPSAYRLLWQGSYYQVWGRRPGAPAAIAHVGLAGGGPAAQCARIGQLAQQAGRRASLVAAVAPELVRVPLAEAPHPETWAQDTIGGLVISTSGHVSAAFRIPRAGVWNVWVQGHMMSPLDLTLDGRPLESIAGQLSGDSLVPTAVPPLPVHLSAGVHRLSAARGEVALGPGHGPNSVIVDAVFLTPAQLEGEQMLTTVPAAGWRALCGRPYSWVELVPGLVA